MQKERCIERTVPGIYNQWKTKKIWLLGVSRKSGKLLSVNRGTGKQGQAAPPGLGKNPDQILEGTQAEGEECLMY